MGNYNIDRAEYNREALVQLGIRVKERNLFLIKERATFELNVRNEVHIDTEISRIQEDILDIYETIDCLLGD
ncbi:MAG: hypothetical protein ACI4A3_03340 [Lachnospiraceae bacterium]